MREATGRRSQIDPIALHRHEARQAGPLCAHERPHRLLMQCVNLSVLRRQPSWPVLTVAAWCSGCDVLLDVVTAGAAFLDAADRVAVESDRAFPPSEACPRASEAVAWALSARGVPSGVMRLPPSVHGPGDHAFVPMLVDIARRAGRSAYGGEGGDLWPAVHAADAARAFRLAVERGAGTETWHAVAEEGVPFRAIAEAIADVLGGPCVSLNDDAARARVGWFIDFASIDQPTSSTRTRALLDWAPQGPDLLTDIRSSG